MLEKLIQLGLTKSEGLVYVYLAKNKHQTVTQISKHTKIHRTTVYEILEKLENKGLVSHVLLTGVQSYSVNSFVKLNDYIDEKRELAQELVLQLSKLKSAQAVEPEVEIHKGKEGIKFLLNDLLRTNKDYVALGINEDRWDELFGDITNRYLPKEKAAKISWRGIVSQNQSTAYKIGNYKAINQAYFSESPTVVYGDCVAHIVYEPLTIIILKNKQLADAQKKHFELLWKLGEKPKLKKLL